MIETNTTIKGSRGRTLNISTSKDSRDFETVEFSNGEGKHSFFTSEFLLDIVEKYIVENGFLPVDIAGSPIIYWQGQRYRMIGFRVPKKGELFLTNNKSVHEAMLNNFFGDRPILEKV